MLDIANFWDQEFESHQEVLLKTKTLLKEDFIKFIELADATLRSGNKIIFFGNGGSAADSQHWATELTVRYQRDRKALAAIALTTDTSALTAIGNDYGFDHIFSRQLEAIGNKGDLAVCISTSGNSGNVIKAVEMANKMEITTIGFTGEDGGKMNGTCDLMLKVPSKITARVQEMHIILGHSLCDILEQENSKEQELAA